MKQYEGGQVQVQNAHPPEGLMLKASTSLYNDRLQWVKMKVCDRMG